MDAPPVVQRIVRDVAKKVAKRAAVHVGPGLSDWMAEAIRTEQQNLRAALEAQDVAYRPDHGRLLDSAISVAVRLQAEKVKAEKKRIAQKEAEERDEMEIVHALYAFMRMH